MMWKNLKMPIHRHTAVLIAADIVSVLLISAIALLVRFDFSFSQVGGEFWISLLRYSIWNILATLLVFGLFRLYSNLWKYAGSVELLMIVFATAAVDLIQWGGMRMMKLPIPRSYFAIYYMLLLCIVCATRFSVRIYCGLRARVVQKTDVRPKHILLYGAGEAAIIILKEIKTSQFVKNKVVSCVLDDNPQKKGTFLMGVPIEGGREQLQRCVESYEIDEIIIAIPSLVNSGRKALIELCTATGCKVSILPGMYQLINQEVGYSMVRRVEIEDLLGRAPVHTDLNLIMNYVSGKVVLVTGGGGSIGSELCRQIAAHQPKQLLILDNYENNAYDLQMELKKTYPKLDLVVVIASVQNQTRIHQIFQTYRPQLIYHAAAHKHVPLMEGSPCEAIKNNVFGTLHVAEEADLCKAERFVMISTDKAVRPTNIMGASKRICEMIVQTFDSKSDTEYVAVRFGNVLGSNGSVIPLFKKQIAHGGPVTVTHPDIIRYFMTIPEAVSLVLQAGAYAKGGEIFILDMGEPVKIADMAKNLIRLSGYIPGEEIPIIYTGLRPGEKLYEELLMEEEKTETENKRIFIGQPIPVKKAYLKEMLDKLYEAAYAESPDIRSLVKELVPEYTIQIQESQCLKKGVIENEKEDLSCIANDARGRTGVHTGGI